MIVVVVIRISIEKQTNKRKQINFLKRISIELQPEGCRGVSLEKGRGREEHSRKRELHDQRPCIWRKP